MDKVFHYVEAIYNDSPIIDYAGNPLTESLPPVHTRNEVARLLTVYPHFDENERMDSDEYRFHYIQRLFDYFQPLTRHIALERKFSTIIRQGYINRNPLNKNTAEYMNNSYKLLMQGELPEINKTNEMIKVQGFSIIGISGTGKTTTIERIISVYPKVIKHTKYKGNIINTYQIPWMKIECPPDGSLKGLCLTFFKQLDDRINTEYSGRYKRFSVDNMIVQMGHLSRLHNVGVLIIDEIQALSLQGVGGINKMLNFFVTLVNSIGIPVIIIGTNKSFDLLNKEFRQALRGAGQGSPNDDWENMGNDKFWEVIMTGLLAYQWTRKPVTKNEELKLLIDALYNESQGILGVAIKLFAVAQMEAILKKTEEVTVDLIQKTFRRHFYSLTPMIKALRSGNKEEINKYEDIKINIERIVDDLEIELQTKNFIKEKEPDKEELRKAYQQKLNLKLAEKISDSKVIQASVKQVLDKFNFTSYELDDLCEKALTIAEEKLLNKKRRSKNKNDDNYPKNDLRTFRKEALNNKKSVYEVMEENNITMNPYEYFCEKGGM